MWTFKTSSNLALWSSWIKSCINPYRRDIHISWLGITVTLTNLIRRIDLEQKYRTPSSLILSPLVPNSYDTSTIMNKIPLICQNTPAIFIPILTFIHSPPLLASSYYTPPYGYEFSCAMCAEFILAMLDIRFDRRERFLLAHVNDFAGFGVLCNLRIWNALLTPIWRLCIDCSKVRLTCLLALTNTI